MNELSLSKQEILEFIIDNPSSHLRKIKKSLDYSMGTIQYYLDMLEKEGKIKSVKTRFYKNYFHINEADEEVLSVLNLESPRNIIIYLIQNEPSTHQDIAKGIGLSSSTVSWHMKRLIELKIVKSEYLGKFTIYSLYDRDAILKILSRCSTTTWGAMINNMADIFSTLNER